MRVTNEPTKILTADLHGVTGGHWEQAQGSGPVVACWGVVHFPNGCTLAGAPYVIHDAPMDMHGAARLAAQRNRFQAAGDALFLALPLRWSGTDWELGRVRFDHLETVEEARTAGPSANPHGLYCTITPGEVTA